MALTITPALKSHMVSNFKLPSNADDAAAKNLIAKKLASGELTGDVLKSLVAPPVSEGNRIKDLVAAEVKSAMDPISAKLDLLLKGNVPAAEPDTVEPGWDALIDAARQKAHKPPVGNDGDSLTTFNLLNGAHGATKEHADIRVKYVTERFDGTTKAATYKSRFEGDSRAGTPMIYEGSGIDEASQRTKAMIAAWFKSDLVLDGVIPNDPEYFTLHDRALIQYAIRNEKFYVDDLKVQKGSAPPARKLTPDEIHSIESYRLGFTKVPLISDTLSGGTQAVPQFFDVNLIITPVLGNQVAPMVNMVDVPRGIAAHTFVMQNPTFAYAPEGTATTIFDATNFISTHDTTFWRAAGVFEVGINFLQDAIPAMFQEIENAYSRKAAEWLDRVTIAGNGTNEPLGIVNTGTVISVPATNPTNGPYVIGDAINLFAAIPLAYVNRFEKDRLGYAMTQGTYFDFRSIATGVTGDTRLVFGMDIASYRLFNTHVGVLAWSGVKNDQIVFCQFGGYRMYRRQGLKFRRESAGLTLLQSNAIAIGADMRFGGQLDLGSFAAVMFDGKPTP